MRRAGLTKLSIAPLRSYTFKDGRVIQISQMLQAGCILRPGVIFWGRCLQIKNDRMLLEYVGALRCMVTLDG